VSAGYVEVEHLESRNGVAVGGRLILPHASAPLEIGVAFQVGAANLFVQVARQRHEAPSVLDLERFDDPVETPEGRVVVSPTMRRLYSVIDVVGPTLLSVLILGETGVGKEGIAETLHARSKRASAKFLKLNCAALPDSLLEAELFGYEKGAFTGATTAKPGLFEAAHGGTVFLDEIGEIGLATQVKLLRVLECGEFLRMGSVVPLKIDVRYIAATNRDLPRLIAAGQFRADLYFRLNGVSLEVPSLSERRDEIEPLARHFARRAAERLGASEPSFDESARSALHAHAWQGNVRELRNAIDRAVVLCGGRTISATHLLLAPTDLDSPDGEETELHAFRTTQGSGADTLARSARVAPERARAVTEEPLGGRHLWPADEPPTAPPSTQRMALPSPETSGPPDFKTEVRALERLRIVEALERHAGNQSRAAAALGISRHTLMKRLEVYNLARPRKRPRD
jgi:DNA-binding NtrC family response regulator